MNCWKAAQIIFELLKRNEQAIIIKFLESFNLEQRRLIISIKYKYSSLLFIAVEHHLVFLVIYFLKRCGADPNDYGWLDGDKLTCLAMATIQHSEILVDILLRYGASAQIVLSPNESTALFYACREGHLKIAELLIKHGADVNSHGPRRQTCLMESLCNLRLCQYLISVGADVNLVNDLRETSLMQTFISGENETITVLLDYKNTDVKIKNYLEEDALHLAVHYSSEDIINRIIAKGSYTKDEVVKVYEMQSCLFYVLGNHEEAKKLWRKALQLNDKPINTPIFENPDPAGQLEEVREYFNDDRIKSLLYLESVSGLKSMFMLYAYTEAAQYVNDAEKYIVLCNYFFKILNSLDDEYFFQAIHQAELFLWHFFNSDFHLEANVLEMFTILVEYIGEIHTRLKRMSPKERMILSFNIESFLGEVIEVFYQLNKNFKKRMHLFYYGIKRIIKLDLRGLSEKSLLQLCAGIHKPLIEPIFLECRANVNSTDKTGRTVLHTLVEDENTSRELIKTIIDNGFEFHRVRFTEYCLPCRMGREEILKHPVKLGSLKCLAAKAFCEKAINCLSDVPYHLHTIIKSHLSL